MSSKAVFCLLHYYIQKIYTATYNQQSYQATSLIVNLTQLWSEMRAVIAAGCLLVAFMAVSAANPGNEQDMEEVH